MGNKKSKIEYDDDLGHVKVNELTRTLNFRLMQVRHNKNIIDKETFCRSLLIQHVTDLLHIQCTPPNNFSDTFLEHLRRTRKMYNGIIFEKIQ